VKDRTTGTLTRVAVSSGGAQGNSGSLRPSITGDGRYVSFDSRASNLVPGDTNGEFDVFLKDLSTGTLSRVSVSGGGAQGNGGSFFGAISAAGGYVVFDSGSSNLVAGDTNGSFDVFVRKR
jgi:Tol biopolymer transport system component